MKILYVIFLSGFLIMQFGCGPTNAEVIKKYETKYQQKREQFKQIAEILSQRGSLADNAICRELNPAISIDEKKDTFNAEAIMFEQLSKPDDEPDFDLLLNGDLLNSLMWTGAKNPLASTNMDDNGDNMEKTLKAALTYRYLIVSRVNEIIEPNVVDKQNYTPGKVTVETFIVDMNDNKVICGFTTVAKSMPSVSDVPIEKSRDVYTGKRNYRSKRYINIKAKPELQQLQGAADSSLWEDSRKQVIGKLKELTKATVELR